MLKRVLHGFFAGFLLLSIVAAFLGCRPTEAKQAEATTIRVGMVEMPPYSLFHVAEEKGFLTDAIKIDAMDFVDSDKVVEAFQRDEVDVIGLSLHEAIELFSKEPSIRSIVVTSVLDSSKFKPDSHMTFLQKVDPDDANKIYVWVVKGETLEIMSDDLKLLFAGWFRAVDFADKHYHEATDIIAQELGEQGAMEEYEFLSLKENFGLFSYTSGSNSLYTYSKAIEMAIDPDDALVLSDLINGSIIKEIYSQWNSMFKLN
jgi:hypothetical protein